jgi:hypothetical protein
MGETAMDADGGFGDGRVQLPESGPAPAERTRGRRDGIRHARRVSNWTAAALMAGTAAIAVGLAHQARPAQVPATRTAVQAAGPSACTQSGNAPQVTHPVATTSASGVTTTTTRAVNCQTVVTQIRNVAAGEDN